MGGLRQRDLPDDRQPAGTPPPDRAHPLGHGREAYVWSLFAALGLFVAGGAVSVTHGVQELIHPGLAEWFVVGYVVLAMSFVLEGVSFLQSVRQARSEAESLQRDLLEHVIVTSDPTLRAVFAEDSAALTGLVIAAAGLGAHQLTGSPVPERGWFDPGRRAAGVVAILLINRNRRFLVGEEADPRVRAGGCPAPCWTTPEVARVTYLRLEVVGPRMVFGDRVTWTSPAMTPSRAWRSGCGRWRRRICASPADGRRGAEPVRPDEPSLQA